MRDETQRERSDHQTRDKERSEERGERRGKET